MASTISVSKGCFVFNKNKFVKRKTGKKGKQEQLLCEDPWYLTYRESWKLVEEKFETLRNDTFASVLNDLVSFVGGCYKSEDVEREISTVPTAALLMGINMPDHGALFSTLSNSLYESVSPHIATLHAQKCKTIRHAIEQMTSQFMNPSSVEESESEDSDDERPVKVKKSQCNMLVLQSWYKKLYQPDILTCNENNKKRKYLEIDQEKFRDSFPSSTKRLKLENDEDDMLRKSPQTNFNYLSKEVESEDEIETIFPKRESCCTSKVRRVKPFSPSSKTFNGVATGLLQKTPTKQKITANENESSPRLQRTPRCSASERREYVESPRSSAKKLFEDESFPNSRSQSNRLINKMNEHNNVQATPTKDRRIQELQKSELRRSPRTPKAVVRLVEEYSGDSDCSVHSPSKQQQETVRRGKDVSRSLRTPLKESMLEDKNEYSTLKTPKAVVKLVEEYSGDSDCSIYSPSKQQKTVRRVKDVSRSLRTSLKESVLEDKNVYAASKTPKAVVKLVEEYSGDSDCSVYSPSKQQKTVRRGKDVSRSLRTPLKESVLEDKNEYATSVKNKIHNIVGSESTQFLRSPKIVLRAIDGVYEVKNMESGDSQKTSVPIARMIDEFCKKKSPTGKKWVCEVELQDVTADKRIPKMILRQLNELKNIVSPPKVFNEEIKPSGILSSTQRRCSPRKIQQTPKKQVENTSKEMETRHSPGKTCPASIKNSDDTKISEHKVDLKQLNVKNDLSSAKSQCLTYKFNQSKKLVVIIPEFEKFSSKVLQDLILILRSCICDLPFVLIMGIATSVAAVHRSLPYRMSACLSIKAFQAPPSVQLLNSVLDQILFSPEFPFRLGNKTFCFLMDAFLYYDLSVKGFVQSIKFCMMEHFCGQDWKKLCCKLDLYDKIKLNAKDIAELRKLPSFTQYLNRLADEGAKEKLMNDDGYTHKTVVSLLKKLHRRVHAFHVGLKLLNFLVADLPKKPLGSHVRELYGIAASSHITRTPEYQECLQLLGFLSRDELIMKLDKMITYLCRDKPPVNQVVNLLSEYRENIQEAGVVAPSPQSSPTKTLVIEGKMSRYAFKEKLMQLSKKDQHQSPFEKAREEFFHFFSTQVFPEMLKPLTSLPLNEVVMFDNVASVRTHIVGAPRAAIHTALNNPQFYLECECCVQTEENGVPASNPDLCIAYKLYRECGRFINLYDWLQAFSSIVDPQDDEEEQREVKPQTQARFTRAVAELQFMGFLKTSSRKVDHVTKLCFDGGF